MLGRLFSVFTGTPAVTGKSDVSLDTSLDTHSTMQADRPIESRSEDLFDRGPFAVQIANVLASRNDPSSLVIGIYSPWGDGKTSTLAMIKECLRAQRDIIVMDYNPWFYGDTTEQLTRSFFKSIKAKLEKTGFFTKEKIGVVMETLGAEIPYVGSGVKRIAEVMTTEALTEARDELGSILKKHQKKVVIFIDDIDRLDRVDIQTLFKLVRLSGGFDNTTYVLAFDDVIVAEALGQNYGSGDPVAGRAFLEKIVQVPLHLPPIRREQLRQLLFEACDRALLENGIELTGDERSELGHALSAGVTYALHTPRQIKLFENAIHFAIPLLKGEVRISNLIQIEALRVLCPRVYDAIRKNPDAVLRSRDTNVNEVRRTPIDTAIDDISSRDEDRSPIRSMVEELFPRSGGTSYGNEWEPVWAGEKRICSRDYFPRYFNYSVPKGDISDLTVENLISQAEIDDPEAVGEIFANFFESGRAELLIKKLRQREESLSLGSIPVIISQISANASKIPISSELYFYDFTVSQAATLITKLAARAEPAKQDEWLIGAIEKTDSLMFGAHILRNSDPASRHVKNSTPLDRERVEVIADALLKRFLVIAKHRDVVNDNTEQLATVIYAIEHCGNHKTNAKLSRFLNQIVAASPENALQMVKALAGRSQESGGPITVSDLKEAAYVSISDVMDAAIIYNQLRKLFGEKIGMSGWQDKKTYDGNVDSRIAEQFAQIHLEMKSLQDQGGEKGL